MKRANLGVLFVVVVVIVGAIFVLESKKPGQSILGTTEAVDTGAGPSANAEKKAQQYPVAKEIVSPSGFINTDSITIQELIGKKVILVDFWTYSCINCQRTLPYLTSWYDKYRDQGLEIVSIHTPEFEFEKDIDNVRRAVEQYGIKYPVVLDNEYGTWRNYANRYWPRKYLIDIDGYIVYDHIGEGGYDETEQKIQELLAERKQALGESGAIDTGVVTPSDVETVDSSRPLSPETYFGAFRNDLLANGIAGRVGEQDLPEPSSLQPNSLYLVGSWDIQSEYAQNQQPGAKIIFSYQAKKVFMVARSEGTAKIRILLDGQPLDTSAGSDVVDGIATINDDRLYRLIEDAQWGQHTLEIVVESGQVQIFTFTFG